MPKAPEKIFGKFKLLHGVHNEGGKTYKRGDVIESASDLLKHNVPGRPRFASLDDVVETEASSQEDTEGFEEMTIAELRSFAEEGDIDLGEASLKADIISKLKQSTG